METQEVFKTVSQNNKFPIALVTAIAFTIIAILTIAGLVSLRFYHRFSYTLNGTLSSFDQEKFMAECGKVQTNDNCLVNLGVKYYENKDYIKAKEYYNQALTENSKSALAYYDLGLVDYDSGDLVNAEINYKKSLELDPNYRPASTNLMLLFKRRIVDYCRGNKEYSKGIEYGLEETDVYIKNNKSKIYLPEYETADVYFEVATCYYNSIELDQAKNFYLKAIEIYPKMKNDSKNTEVFKYLGII